MLLSAESKTRNVPTNVLTSVYIAIEVDVLHVDVLNCPLQSFDWRTDFQLRRDTACWICFVRSIKSILHNCNFESAIVKLQFPL